MDQQEELQKNNNNSVGLHQPLGHLQSPIEGANQSADLGGAAYEQVLKPRRRDGLTEADGQVSLRKSQKEEEQGKTSS